MRSDAFQQMEMLRKKAERGMKLELAGGIGIIILPVGLALLIAGINMKEKSYREMDELYREVFIREPFEANFGNTVFESLEGFSEEMVEGFQLFMMGNEFDSEAYGKAVFNDASIEISNVTIDDYDRMAKKDNTTIYFKGRMFVIEFPEKIAASEKVYSRSFSYRELSKEEESCKTDIENGTSEKLFDTYLSGTEDAGKPVSVQLLDRLKSLDKRHKGIAVKLEGNKLILALNDGDGIPFYRSKAKNISFDKELKRAQKDLDDIKAIITILKNLYLK